MITRSQASLVLGVAPFYTFVVVNNLTEYNTTYQFIRHVLMMDSTFPDNRRMWRALHQPAWHTVFSIPIIVWESLTMIPCWCGGLRLLKSFKG
jgi:predicted small integral membrane protein